MAIKDLIGPSFVGTETIEFIVTRGLGVSDVLVTDPTYIASHRYGFSYDQYIITQNDEGTLKLNKGYTYADPVTPGATDVIGSMSLEQGTTDSVIHQLGDGSLKVSKGTS